MAIKGQYPTPNNIDNLNLRFFGSHFKTWPPEEKPGWREAPTHLKLMMHGLDHQQMQ